MSEPLPVSIETMAAQALGDVDPLSGDLVPAIHMSTTPISRSDTPHAVTTGRLVLSPS
jgi:hypothetical protein